MALLSWVLLNDFAGSPVILVTTPFVVFDARPRQYAQAAAAHAYVADAEGAPVLHDATARAFLSASGSRGYLFPARQRQQG